MTDQSDDSLPPWTEEELAVLRSADQDRPGARSLAATLGAVGAGSAIASTVTTAKGAAVLGNVASASAKWGVAATIAKWAGIVALGSGVVTGGVVLIRRSAESAARARAPSRSVSGTPAPVAAKETAPSPAATEEVASDAPAPAPSGAGRRAVTRAQPDISQEIAALDEARAALRSGRAAESLAALDRYGAAYPKGSLRVEATALRIEALLRSGRRDRAEALADAFLVHNPKSPYAARIRTLLAGAPTGR
jgi:hypothetical protein